jgi:hypothetical protein
MVDHRISKYPFRKNLSTYGKKFQSIKIGEKVIYKIGEKVIYKLIKMIRQIRQGKRTTTKRYDIDVRQVNETVILKWLLSICLSYHYAL